MRDDVLIVDDEPKIGALIRAALERDGLGVEAVQDPEKALALLKERPFEVVLTDLMMPGIDGSVAGATASSRALPAARLDARASHGSLGSGS